MYRAIILADSIPCQKTWNSKSRLVTMEVCHPRFILAEMNTHRDFSRNSASSRAIPVEKRIKQVRESPFIPASFSKNQRGMQASEMLEGWQHERSREAWIDAAKRAADYAEALNELGVHKQHANRLLEPFCWHTAVISSTRWENFFNLRCHPAAQPEMQIIANLMREAYNESDPVELDAGEWHLPYLDQSESSRSIQLTSSRDLLCASVVRCAAVSYERQDAERSVEQYRERHDMLAKMGHWSPFEHQAMCTEPILTRSNFDAPWLQYRKTFDGEAVFRG